MIRPYMDRMTESELFATMTGGFATVAGSVFAAYVSFGVRRTPIFFPFVTFYNCTILSGLPKLSSLCQCHVSHRVISRVKTVLS